MITCWYTRFEVGKRLAGFWILSVLTGGFSAIFAYVLTLLTGKGGLNGWQWIFIIEGAITVFVCIAGWFIIIDFPAKADKFLKPEEKQFVIDRINNDRGDAEEDEVTLAKILFHLKDWRLYFWGINLMASTFPGYAYSYFLPVILRLGMGYSRSESQLLSAPPYVLAAIITYTSGWLSDRYHIRGPLIAFHQLVTAAGMLITAFGKSNAVRYFGAFLGKSSWCLVIICLRCRYWLPTILYSWHLDIPSKQHYLSFKESCCLCHMYHRWWYRRCSGQRGFQIE